MLQLQIRFESSWTNSFYDGPGGEPLFTSGSQLMGSVKGLTTVDMDRVTTIESKSRVAFLQKLQKANPGLLYKVPESFDRTVQGVLARLVGEVRRLSAVEGNHLALRAFGSGTYSLNIEHEHSQTTKLATYEVNDIQTGGAGLIKNEVLYSKSKESAYLFGHLGLSLDDIQFKLSDLLSTSEALPSIGDIWTPSSPSELIEKIRKLDDEQGEVIKAAHKAAGKGSYHSPYSLAFEELTKAFPQDANAALAKQSLLASQGKKAALSINEGALEGWSIAGAVIAARIKLLDDAALKQFIQAGALTKNGGLAGLAMSGAVGNITPKDVFNFATGVRAESNRMPYAVEIPIEQPDGRKQFVPSGILKKTGTLVFEIDQHPELEKELDDAIKAASVGPFHFGKKGIAYVAHLKRY